MDCDAFIISISESHILASTGHTWEEKAGQLPAVWMPNVTRSKPWNAEMDYWDNSNLLHFWEEHSVGSRYPRIETSIILSEKGNVMSFLNYSDQCTMSRQNMTIRITNSPHFWVSGLGFEWICNISYISSDWKKTTPASLTLNTQTVRHHKECNCSEWALPKFQKIFL